MKGNLRGIHLMKFVGDALETLALSEAFVINSDLLGRSAFNRYYYASFLLTRKLLGDLNESWKRTPHKNIPELLRLNLKRNVAKALDLQVRKGLISKSQKSKILTNLQTSVEELSELLERAYDARIIADYIPEETVTIDGKIIFLRSYKLTTAKQWPNRAEIYCKSIYKVWKEAGLV
jgi:hypothetical protein